MLKYYVFTLDSVFKSVHLKAQNQLDKPVCYTHTLFSQSMLMKLYICMGICLFFKIHVNHFMARDDSPGAKIISKCIFWVRGLVPFSEF